MDKSIQSELSSDATFIIIGSGPIMIRSYQRLLFLQHLRNRKIADKLTQAVGPYSHQDR